MGVHENIDNERDSLIIKVPTDQSVCYTQIKEFRFAHNYTNRQAISLTLTCYFAPLHARSSNL